jgi:hypothetical protein
MGNRLTTHKVKSIDILELDAELEESFEAEMQQEIAALRALTEPAEIELESDLESVSDDSEDSDSGLESEEPAAILEEKEFLPVSVEKPKSVPVEVPDENPVVIDLSVDAVPPKKVLQPKPKKTPKPDPDDGGGQITLF